MPFFWGNSILDCFGFSQVMPLIKAQVTSSPFRCFSSTHRLKLVRSSCALCVGRLQQRLYRARRADAPAAFRGMCVAHWSVALWKFLNPSLPSTPCLDAPLLASRIRFSLFLYFLCVHVGRSLRLVRSMNTASFPVMRAFIRVGSAVGALCPTIANDALKLRVLLLPFVFTRREE